jgi:hypothetical protein
MQDLLPILCLIGVAGLFVFIVRRISRQHREERAIAIAKSGPEEAAYSKLDAEVVSEIRQGTNSKYYAHPQKQFAGFEHFDTERMIDDFSKSYPMLPREGIKKVVMQAIYYNFLR